MRAESPVRTVPSSLTQKAAKVGEAKVTASAADKMVRFAGERNKSCWIIPFVLLVVCAGVVCVGGGNLLIS